VNGKPKARSERSERRPIAAAKRRRAGGNRTYAKLALLATLYLAQGLPFGFFTQALPSIMRDRKYSLEAIGLASLLALPWALKFLWAPFVDRFGSQRFGARKTFIVPLQIGSAILLLALSAIDPMGPIAPILVGVLLVNLFAATQDIATDGLAVDLLEEEERGLANGVQVAGYRVGMIIGGGALLMIYDDIQWRGVFLAMAGLVALTTVPILAHREQIRPRSTEPFGFAFLRRPGAASIIALLFAYKLGAYLLSGMLRPYMIDGGQSLEDIGVVLGTYGFVSGLLGALAGGALVNRFRRRTALLVFGGAQTLGVLAFAILALEPIRPDALAAAAALEHFTSGMATAALFTAMMDWSSRGSAATDYTIQASVVVIATSAGSALSGYSASALGYAPHFALATAVSAAGTVIAFRLYPARTA
jgi:RhtX/FptX family siderophore transporter